MYKFILAIVFSFFINFGWAEGIQLPPKPTHILMIRHAETYRNAEGKEIQGWIDDAAAQLNTKGQAQADELGKALANRYKDEITIFYSSPLGRCMETSERIAQHFSNLLILKDRRFMEICHGQHDTMPYKERNEFCLQRYGELEKEFKEQFPDKEPDRFFKWKINPLSERTIPSERIENPLEGELETAFQLFERATSAIEEIGKNHPGETILISSHAALIKTLSDEAEYRERGDMSPLPVYYEPKSPASKSHLLPGNCVVYHFVWEAGKLTFMGTEDLLTGAVNK